MSICPQVSIPFPTSHNLSHAFAFRVVVGFEVVMSFKAVVVFEAVVGFEVVAGFEVDVKAVVASVVTIHRVSSDSQTQFSLDLQTIRHLRSHLDIVVACVVVGIVVVLPQNVNSPLLQWHSFSSHTRGQWFLHGSVRISTAVVVVVGVVAAAVFVVIRLFSAFTPTAASTEAVKQVAKKLQVAVKNKAKIRICSLKFTVYSNTVYRVLVCCNSEGQASHQNPQATMGALSTVLIKICVMIGQHFFTN